MTDQESDDAKTWRVIAEAVRAEGYAGVTVIDVEEAHRAMLAGREPNGIIGRAIVRHLRRLEEGGGGSASRK